MSNHENCNQTPENENIHLTLPVNASYVSAARLTASSIANRMGFDIDEIEDIKAAVSEACTFIIKKMPHGKSHNFTLFFEITPGVLKIKLTVDAGVDLSLSEDEMGLIMIKALMDDLVIDDSLENNLCINMTKSHKIITFE